MFSMNIFRRSSRPYAQRGYDDLGRKAMVSARVHHNAHKAVLSLAQERGMSVSEYVARVLNDHLRYVEGMRTASRVRSLR
jgi:hypothetical protein